MSSSTKLIAAAVVAATLCVSSVDALDRPLGNFDFSCKPAPPHPSPWFGLRMKWDCNHWTSSLPGISFEEEQMDPMKRIVLDEEQNSSMNGVAFSDFFQEDQPKPKPRRMQWIRNSARQFDEDNENEQYLYKGKAQWVCGAARHLDEKEKEQFLTVWPPSRRHPQNGFSDKDELAINAGISGDAGGRPAWNDGVSHKWDEERVLKDFAKTLKKIEKLKKFTKKLTNNDLFDAIRLIEQQEE